MRCQGVRGATTVAANDKEEILTKTQELLEAMVAQNGIQKEDIGSVYFTTTRDVIAEYPAVAARRLGWYDHALLCGHEMEVPEGLDRCIRVLIHWNTDTPHHEILHVYLHGAEVLRPERTVD